MTPEKLERELLARLGLDSSATPEDVDAAHETVTAYLAAAPRDLRSWARTQAAGADEAYALLTDPAALARAVALVGAGARSAVLPGGPATPPAHRDTPAPAAAAVPPTAAAAAGPRARRATTRTAAGSSATTRSTPSSPRSTPTAHREVVGTPAQRAAALAAVQPASAPAARSSLSSLARLEGVPQPRPRRRDRRRDRDRRRRRLQRRRSGARRSAPTPPPAPPPRPAPRSSTRPPSATLMAKIQANPEGRRLPDGARRRVLQGRRLRDRGQLVHQGHRRSSRRTCAASWPSARPPSTAATSTRPRWPGARPLDIDDTNVEAHYDLGFLYLNRQPRRHGAGAARTGAGSSSWIPTARSPDGEGPPRRHRQHGRRRSPAPGAPASPAAAHGRRPATPRPPRRPPPPRPRARSHDLDAGSGSASSSPSSPASSRSPRRAACRSCPPTSGTWWAPPATPDRRRSFLHGLAFVDRLHARLRGLLGLASGRSATSSPTTRSTSACSAARSSSSSASRSPASSTCGPSGATRARCRPSAGRAHAAAAAASAASRHAAPRWAAARARRRASAPARRRHPGYGRSLLFGVVFAAGWSPCIGPILGGIIGLASATASVAQGTVLLLAYAAGLAVPFLAVAMGATWVARRLGWVGRHHRAVSLVSGAMLVVLGVLMVTNLLARLAAFTAPFGG